ncbi:MAG: hypothetical protein LBK58_15580 [Prevotellaceae bacterium]|jgi:hypothetical protein|nr:hypothetical protein [Prevotellaceae bacterium]
MKHLLYPLKFEFVELSKKKITEEEKRFYLSTIKALTRENALTQEKTSSKRMLLLEKFLLKMKLLLKQEKLSWILESGETEKLFYTIPIIQSSSSDSDILKNKFAEWIASANLLTEQGMIRKDGEFYICLDIRGIKRDQLFGSMFRHLSNILEKSKETGNIRFFIFQDVLLSDFSEKDIFYELLQEDIDKGFVFLIDETGNFHPKKSIEQYNPSKYNEKLKQASPDPKELFRRKLIRRTGHFKVMEKRNRCHRYFYDGRFCEEEIKILVMEFIKNQDNNKELEFIIYAAKYSPWLQPCIEHLSTDIMNEPKRPFPNYQGAHSYEDIIKDSGKIIDKYHEGKVLFISDLIFTGTSMKDMIREMRPVLFEKINGLKDNVFFLSILNSESQERILNVDGSNYQIQYLLDVEIETKFANNGCPLCKLIYPMIDLEKRRLMC